MPGDPLDDVDLPITNPGVALAQHGEKRVAPKSPSRLIFQVLAVVGVVTALLILAPTAWLTTAQWSAWATAVQAFGTVMAFAAAAAAFWWQWLRERDRDQKRADVERRSQARRVHGWVAVENPSTVVNDNPPFIAYLENRSDEPIYKAVIEIVDGRVAGEPTLSSTPLDDQRASADVVSGPR